MIKIPENKEAAFFVCTFSLLGKLVECDGWATEEEERAVAEFIVDSLDVYGKKRELAMDVFTEAFVSPLSFRDYAQQFYQHFEDRDDIRVMLLEVLWQIAVTDHELTEKEEDLLRQAGKVFKIAPERVDAIAARAEQSASVEHQIEEPYLILGCTEKSTDYEVRSAYKRIVGRLSKEKLDRECVPDEFYSLIKENLDNVEQAYQYIKQARGFSGLDD